MIRQLLVSRREDERNDDSPLALTSNKASRAGSILSAPSHPAIRLSSFPTEWGEHTISFQVRELLAQETIKFLRSCQQLPDLLPPIFTKWLLEARSLSLEMMTPPPIRQRYLVGCTYNRSDLTGECMNSTPILSTYTPMRCFSISSRVSEVEVPSPASDLSGAAVAGGTDGSEADGGRWRIPFRGYAASLSSPYLEGLRAPTGPIYQLHTRYFEALTPGPSGQEDQSVLLYDHVVGRSRRIGAKEHSCSYYQALLWYLPLDPFSFREWECSSQSGSSYLAGTLCPKAASS